MSNDAINRPKRQPKPGQSKGAYVPKGKADFSGFVNWKPKESERSAFETYCADPLRHSKVLHEILENGWKLTVAADRTPGVYVATVSCWDAGHPSGGIILNTRSKDPERSLLGVCFALTVVYDYELSDWVVGGADDGVL
jgi:hypothetical protein